MVFVVRGWTTSSGEGDLEDLVEGSWSSGVAATRTVDCFRFGFASNLVDFVSEGRDGTMTLESVLLFRKVSERKSSRAPQSTHL